MPVLSTRPFSPLPAQQPARTVAILGRSVCALVALAMLAAVPGLYIWIRWNDHANTPSINDAAAEGDIPRMRDLIRAGANINSPSLARSGDAPLHCAVAAGQVKSVEFLLNAGAAVDALNDRDETPLFRAGTYINGRAYNGSGDADHATVARLLLAHGADPNRRNSHGDTPLGSAIRAQNVELVRMLLDHGASATIPNDDGNTPLDAAKAMTHSANADPRVLELITTASAKPTSPVEH